MAKIPSLPPTLKSLQHYMKIATEHDKRDPVVAYYARMYVAQQGITIDGKSTEARTFLIGLMDALESTKKANVTQTEAFKDDIVAQAIIEEYCLKLFSYADAEDRNERFNKNVVKAFYTAGMLMDVLTQFSELSDEVQHKRKYAKWKAAHIHACLKNGEKPHPGPMPLDDEEDDQLPNDGGGAVGGNDFGNPSGGFPTQPNPIGFSAPAPYDPQGNAFGNTYPRETSSNQWPDPNFSLPTAPPVAPSFAYTDPPPVNTAAPASQGGLTTADFQKAQKFCKFASSALTYEDTATAIDNLEKALRLLKTGKE